MKIKWKSKDYPQTGIVSKWIVVQDVLQRGDLVTWTENPFGIYKQAGYDFCCENGNWWRIGEQVRPATNEEIISHLNK